MKLDLGAIDGQRATPVIEARALPGPTLSTTTLFIQKLSAQRVNFDLQEGRYKATWKMEFKLSWREAGPPNHPGDTVNSDK